MGIVKFIKSKNKLGSLQESKTTPDAIYFPTDSTSIIMGGKEYGGQPLTEEQLQAVNSGVTEEWVADVDGQLAGLKSDKADAPEDLFKNIQSNSKFVSIDGRSLSFTATDGGIFFRLYANRDLKIFETVVLAFDVSGITDNNYSIIFGIGGQNIAYKKFIIDHNGSYEMPIPIAWNTSNLLFDNIITTVGSQSTSIKLSDIKFTSENAEYKDYIVSRGENLVTNGTAFMGNNYNFQTFLYSGEDAYYSGGCFVSEVTQSGTRMYSQEYIPVDVDSTYKLSYVIKVGTEDCHFYDFLAMYDIDKNSIEAPHIMYMSGSTTKLSEDLKDGDTVVHLESTAGFDKTVTQTYRKGFIVWNYKNSKGYQYAPETYSRNVYTNLWSDNETQIDTDNNTITLNAAWNKGTIPAGTSLSQANDGGTFSYGNSFYTANPDSWTKKSALWSGLGKNNAGHTFREGTAFVRLGWLLYKGSTNSYVKFSTISLTRNVGINENVASATTASKASKVSYSTTNNNSANTIWFSAGTDTNGRSTLCQSTNLTYNPYSKVLANSGTTKTTSLLLSNNSTIGSDTSTNLYIKAGDTYPLVVDTNVVRRGISTVNATLGTSSYPWKEIYGTTIYENSTKLSDKYLGKTATATKATGDEDGNNIKDTYAKKSEINNLDDRLISTVDDVGTYRTRLRGNIDIIETDEILGEIYPPTMTITDDPFEAKADSNIIVATPTEISLKTYSDYGYSSGEDPANETTISSTAISTKEIKADKITKGGRSVLTTNDILGQLGQDTTKVMSQAAVTSALNQVSSSFATLMVYFDESNDSYHIEGGAEADAIAIITSGKPFNVSVVNESNPDDGTIYLATAAYSQDMGITYETTAFVVDMSILGFKFLKITCDTMDTTVSFVSNFGLLS